MALRGLAPVLLERLRAMKSWPAKAFLIACAFVLASCSSQQNQPASTPAPKALHNTSGFPLYPGASIVTTHAFTQNVQIVNASQNGSIFSGGNGVYTGNEVIAATPASFSDLSAWIAQLAQSPPQGYVSVENGNNPDEETQAQQYGLDYATFKKKEGSSTHGVLVIAMDPQRVNQRFGRILGMIAKYRALPEVMREPIDNAAKARIGMTITQATQPDSPIGAALSALNEFQHKDARGIVVIDAAKR